jgi:hypothetical protein
VAQFQELRIMRSFHLGLPCSLENIVILITLTHCHFCTTVVICETRTSKGIMFTAAKNLFLHWIARMKMTPISVYTSQILGGRTVCSFGHAIAWSAPVVQENMNYDCRIVCELFIKANYRPVHRMGPSCVMWKQYFHLFLKGWFKPSKNCHIFSFFASSAADFFGALFTFLWSKLFSSVDWKI